MSLFLQNNKTAIHIASEVVIFGIAMFVVYRKTNSLSENIRVLEERVVGMEKAFEEQKKIIHKLQAHVNKLQMPSPYPQFPAAPVQRPPSQPTIPNQNFYQRPPPSSSVQEGDQTRNSQPSVIYITNQVQSTPATLSTIEEVDENNEEDEIDKSIQKELEELKKSDTI